MSTWSRVSEESFNIWWMTQRTESQCQCGVPNKVEMWVLQIIQKDQIVACSVSQTLSLSHTHTHTHTHTHVHTHIGWSDMRGDSSSTTNILHLEWIKKYINLWSSTFSVHIHTHTHTHTHTHSLSKYNMSTQFDNDDHSNMEEKER